MNAEDKKLLIGSHGCALCKNLSDLRESCCCHEGELVEITESRLLKRCNLKQGERLCTSHFNKVKNGLIFGVEKSGCSAPFHIDGSGGNRLRSVPKTWRHLFDSASSRDRYSPAVKICNRCYKITFDLMLKGEEGNPNAASTWDLSPTSPTSTLSTGSYTSPRRWLSSFTLHANESSTSGSSLSSSTTRLSSGSSSYLLSLYETHRENLGHPRTIPDSIRRYFKYKQATPFLSPLSTSQSLTKQRFESTDFSDKSLSDADEPKHSKAVSIPNPPEPKFQTFSPKISLICNSSLNTPSSRQASKLILANSNIDGFEDQVFLSSNKSDSSFEVSSVWESLSLSDLSNVDADYNEICNSVTSNPIQENKELQSPRRVSSESSLSSKSDADKLDSVSKPMSIDVQFIVNPLLKRSHLTSQTEMCKSFDSFSTNTDELIARAQNFKGLDILSNSSKPNSEIFDQSFNSSVDTNELLSENSFVQDPHEKMEYLEGNTECIEEKRQISGLCQNDDNSNLIKPFNRPMLRLAQVFANTLAQCIIDFALLDAVRKLHSKIEVTEPKRKFLEDLATFDDDNNRIVNFSAADLISFSNLQAEQILADVLNNVIVEKQIDRPSLEMQKTEFSFTTPTTQYLSLDRKQFDRKNVTNYSVPSSSKTVIRWLEKKTCYRTVFSVQFKNRFEPEDASVFGDFREDFAGSMTLDFNPLNFRLVECVVDDLIPITRSFSTGFIDKCNESALLDRIPSRLRASSLDSFFTLTCKPTSSTASLNKQFSAVPVDRLKCPFGESGVFLSSSTGEHFSSEDEAPIRGRIKESENFSAFENVSISSGATDFSSSSTMDDCDIIQAELLEKSKISDRPHFVSHKSRIDEANESIPKSMSVPFELKPELMPFQEKEEEEEDDEEKSLESFNAGLECESHYEDAFSTTGAVETSLQDLPENSVANTDSVKPEEADAISKDTQRNKNRKISSVGRKGAKSFDWYVGEDLVEQRRSTQLLKVLSEAALFTTQTQKSRRDLRARKTDEEPEDEDVSDIISQALEEYTPKFLFRRYREEAEGSNDHRKLKLAIRIAAIVGFVGSLVYAGWKYYS